MSEQSYAQFSAKNNHLPCLQYMCICAQWELIHVCVICLMPVFTGIYQVFLAYLKIKYGVCLAGYVPAERKMKLNFGLFSIFGRVWSKIKGIKYLGSK